MLPCDVPATVSAPHAASSADTTQPGVREAKKCGRDAPPRAWGWGLAITRVSIHVPRSSVDMRSQRAAQRDAVQLESTSNVLC